MEKELYNFYLEGDVTFMQVYKVERAQSQDLNPVLPEIRVCTRLGIDLIMSG